jgi:hypothetical protein
MSRDGTQLKSQSFCHFHKKSKSVHGVMRPSLEVHFIGYTAHLFMEWYICVIFYKIPFSYLACNLYQFIDFRFFLFLSSCPTHSASSRRTSETVNTCLIPDVNTLDKFRWILWLVFLPRPHVGPGFHVFHDILILGNLEVYTLEMVLFQTTKEVGRCGFG